MAGVVVKSQAGAFYLLGSQAIVSATTPCQFCGGTQVFFEGWDASRSFQPLTSLRRRSDIREQPVVLPIILDL